MRVSFLPCAFLDVCGASSRITGSSTLGAFTLAAIVGKLVDISSEIFSTGGLLAVSAHRMVSSRLVRLTGESMRKEAKDILRNSSSATRER